MTPLIGHARSLINRSRPFVCLPRRGSAVAFALLAFLLTLTACRSPQPNSQTVTVLIENSPNSLDPRLGTDAMAERIDGLLFDSLVRKDEHFLMQPWLATSWDQPNPLTWIFHLRDGVRFTDGRPLEAEDAAFTINSLLPDSATAGSLSSSKSGNFSSVLRASAPDRLTLRLDLKRPDASLLFNLSDGLFGVIPRSSPRDFAQAPIGSGPYRFLSASQDKEVLVERNPVYWAGPPNLEQLRFAVVPDAVTVALELQKGSADIAANELTLDLVHAIESAPNLQVESGPGSPVLYLNFNVVGGFPVPFATSRSNPLHDVRVRQAIACAIDRQAIVDAAWRGQARLADTLLPPGHWAAADPGTLSQYPHDPARARALLDEAGYSPEKRGSLHLEMKTSQDETTRLLALILQQQLADAGIVLTLRASEFGTFYADVTSGRFEMYALRWIGSNEDPDIFRYAYASGRVPPKGANRGHYSNPAVDALLAAAAASTDQAARRTAYVQVQQILAAELPGIPLWYPNNQIVHTRRIHGIHSTLDGSFAFLRTATLD